MLAAFFSCFRKVVQCVTASPHALLHELCGGTFGRFLHHLVVLVVELEQHGVAVVHALILLANGSVGHKAELLEVSGEQSWESVHDDCIVSVGIRDPLCTLDTVG